MPVDLHAGSNAAAHHTALRGNTIAKWGREGEQSHRKPPGGRYCCCQKRPSARAYDGRSTTRGIFSGRFGPVACAKTASYIWGDIQRTSSGRLSLWRAGLADDDDSCPSAAMAVPCSTSSPGAASSGGHPGGTASTSCLVLRWSLCVRAPAELLWQRAGASTTSAPWCRRWVGCPHLLNLCQDR